MIWVQKGRLASAVFCLSGEYTYVFIYLYDGRLFLSAQKVANKSNNVVILICQFL